MTKGKRIIIAGSVSVALSACTTGNQSGLILSTTALAKQICSFVPTADTILALFNTKDPQLALASGIAHAICHAVAPPGQPERASGTVSVKGIPIRGSFQR
jgi:hypothetical protein